MTQGIQMAGISDLYHTQVPSQFNKFLLRVLFPTTASSDLCHNPQVVATGLNKTSHCLFWWKTKENGVCRVSKTKQAAVSQYWQSILWHCLPCSVAHSPKKLLTQNLDMQVHEWFDITIDYCHAFDIRLVLWRLVCATTCMGGTWKPRANSVLAGLLTLARWNF